MVVVVGGVGAGVIGLELASMFSALGVKAAKEAVEPLKLVRFPGDETPIVRGSALAALIKAERVTVAAAVPTVWVDLLGPAA